MSKNVYGNEYDLPIYIGGQPYNAEGLVVQYYADYVDRICTEIKRLFPRAKMIFATSTPVIDSDKSKTSRFNSDTERYNAVATEVVRRHGGIINDLYALMSDKPQEYHSDVTHYYTKDGARVLTEQVVSVIGEAIGAKGKKLDFDEVFAFPSEIIGH